ncbi:MAG: GMC family oxidoreductase [Nitrospinota bacterium]|nr:GMC family oxidoreductase [Nitrospinota bacterium]
MNTASFDFDVIVIGSGFGGSVMTCRLAEKGHKVCLLERGQRYGMNQFPRRPEEVRSKTFWDPEDGMLGYMQFHSYYESDAFTIAASGLGGGSLIYANVLMPMKPEFFAGWPGGITRRMLDKYYDRALGMLEASSYPFDDAHPYYRDTPKTTAMEKASRAIDDAEDSIEQHKFILPKLAVRFQGDFPGHQQLNQQGAIQSSCTKCGECFLGCNIKAKNTLDMNYLARATSSALPDEGGVPAEIRTQSMVTEIVPVDGGYEVSYVHPERMDVVQKLTAKRVVLAAGSVGSSTMLLKMKKYKKLTGLSDMLGKKWCGNGDLEGMVLFADEETMPTKGPNITSAIEYRFMDYVPGFPHGMYIQDGGFPPFLSWFIIGKFPSPSSFISVMKLSARLLARFLRLNRIFRFRKEINLGDDVAAAIDKDDYIRSMMMLLGMGRDLSDGEVRLTENDTPNIQWKMKRSKTHFDRVRREMKKIARALGGNFLDNPLTYFDKVVAVHPLGGCVMGDTPSDGVVNTKGEVFGHPGLYVCDASVLPTSTGPNPSLTITALAEYFAEEFPAPEMNQ